MALIVGIILAFLKRTRRTGQNNAVYMGIAVGVAVSILFAYVVSLVWGSFEGTAEEIFEGVTMLLAGGLLTSMIWWFLKQQKSIRLHLESKVTQYSDRWARVGLFLVVFFAILREGVETVLFMSAIFLRNGDVVSVALSAFGGLFVALGLGYLIFVVEKKLNLKWFFRTSNVLLILFAAGLMAHGVHELQEAGVVPTFIEHVYDMNGVFDENSVLGSFAKALFGYNGNPSLIEIVTYVTYLGAIVVGFGFWPMRKTDKVTE